MELRRLNFRRTADVDTQTYPGNRSASLYGLLRKLVGHSSPVERWTNERESNPEASEDVGAEVVSEMAEDLMTEVAVDRYMADQIGVLMALANGKSSVGVPSVSLHVQSVQQVLNVCLTLAVNALRHRTQQ